MTFCARGEDGEVFGEAVGAAEEGEGGAADFDGVGAGVEDLAEAAGFGLVVGAGEEETVVGVEVVRDGREVFEFGGGEERLEIGGAEVELGGDGGGIALVQAPEVEEFARGWEGGGHRVRFVETHGRLPEGPMGRVCAHKRGRWMRDFVIGDVGADVMGFRP
ncbi:MAG: hypothetical protein AABZ53_11245 [Planctomycetota bacterium]